MVATGVAVMAAAATRTGCSAADGCVGDTISDDLSAEGAGASATGAAATGAGRVAAIGVLEIFVSGAGAAGSTGGATGTAAGTAEGAVTAAVSDVATVVSNSAPALASIAGEGVDPSTGRITAASSTAGITGGRAGGA